MKLRILEKPLAATALAAAMLFSGCGGGSSSATKVTVSMIPGNGSAVNLYVNQTYTITAQAVGSTDQSVTFALSYILASDATKSPAPTPTACPANPTPTTNPNCGTLSSISSTSTSTTTNGTTVTNTWYSVTYTAPAQVSNPAVIIYITATATADSTATAKATLNLSSGIAVSVTPTTATIGTGETFTFTATTTNDPNNAVTWSLQQTGQVTTGAGTIDASGKYTAPATVPSNAIVSVVATSSKDPTRSASATVTLVDSATSIVSFSGIAPGTQTSPVVAPQGALFHDIYLQAKNLRSTTTVDINGVAADTNQVKIINSTVARLRLNATNLQTADASPTSPALTITVVVDSTTNPVTTAPTTPSFLNQVSVVPVRPGLIASIPDSAAVGTTNQIQVNGGFFGPSGSPIVSTEFDGSPLTTFAGTSPRQLLMSPLAGAWGADGPGLYQFGVTNSSATPSMAAGNVAVQPDPLVTPPTSLSTLPLGAGTAPVAIAEDTTAGIAIVANSGSNTIQAISITPGSIALVGAAVAVTASPTAVAVDEGQHIVAVTSQYTSVPPVTNPPTPPTIQRYLQLYDYSASTGVGSLLSTIDLTAATTKNPVAVALDPNRKLGLVVFASTSVGLIFNTDPTVVNPACLAGLTGTALPTSGTPPCVIGAVDISTGTNPQIAFHPRLHWAFVTPGGAGQLSVVDLSAPPTNVDISSITLNNSSITVTTKTDHSIDPARLPSVLITGAADSSFNGFCTVTAVLDARDFTCTPLALPANATTTGGKVSYSWPLMTFAISPSIRGIALNPQTDRFVLADSNNNAVSFLSALDQTTAGLAMQNPATGAGFQPFTNVAVVVKPGPLGVDPSDYITLIDPGTPGQSLPKQLAQIPTGGTGSAAVVVDPATNQALVANTTSNNVSLIALGGAMKVPQISSIAFYKNVGTIASPIYVPDLSRQIFPQATFYDPAAAPAGDLIVRVYGAGFSSGTPQVRLDGAPVGTNTTVDNDRQLTVTIPAAALTAPRRYALDVVIGTAVSNVTDFTVVAAVNVGSTGCYSPPPPPTTATNPQPTGVAIDDIRDLAVVTNIGCNSINVINLNSGLITSTIPVGTAPSGVATLPRLGYAVVANSNLNLTDGSSLGTGSVSVVDLGTNAIISGGAINVGTAPTGVAINQDTGKAYVVNTLSNTMSVIDLTAAPPTFTTVSTDQRPVSVAVDPENNVALVGAVQQSGSSSSGILDVMDISAVNPTIKGRISTFASLPSGIAFDPSAWANATTTTTTTTNNPFYAVSSLSNSLIVASPSTGGSTSVRVGMNPTSVAYNFQTGTLLTRNTASNTLSFVDMQSLRTREVISLGLPAAPNSVVLPQYTVAIHPRMNLAVVADPDNERVLLMPMPQ